MEGRRTMRTVLRTASGMRAGCRKGVTLALLFLLILAAPLAAQPAQPTQVDPNAAAVSEQQLLQHRNQVQGQISIPDKRENMLIHPAGRDLRAFHEVTLPWIGGGGLPRPALAPRSPPPFRAP